MSCTKLCIQFAILNIFLAVACRDFPGPGAQHHRTGATFNPIKQFIHSEDNHVDLSFQDFVRAHSKTYENSKEEQTRLNIFRHNIRFIHSTNRKGLTYTLGVNHLADKTDEELSVRIILFA